MSSNLRKQRSRAMALGAALLFASAVGTVEAGSIDVRVSPDVRVLKTSPEPATQKVTARWSRTTPAQRQQAQDTQLRVVHYPTVVLGTANHIQAATGTTLAVNDVRFRSPVTYYGDMLPMQFGGAAFVSGATGTVIDGVIVDGVVVAPGTLGVTGFANTNFRSALVGVAGPGFGFGVAGPALTSGTSGLRLNGVTQGVTLDNGGISRGAVSTGAGSTANMVIGTGGASLGGAVTGVGRGN